MDEDQLNSRFFTKIFYGSIGVAASLFLFIVFYTTLRLDSSIESLIENTIQTPLYFWPYVFFTFATAILFGINTALIFYRWRNFGIRVPNFKKESASTALSSLFGIASSACPSCGSTLLSLVGLGGGLAIFPFAGLELKALSFGLIGFATFLSFRNLRCAPPASSSLQEKDTPWFFFTLLLTIALFFLSWDMLKTDPVMARIPGNAAISQETKPILEEMLAKVLPEDGFHTRIVFGESILNLVEQGVIDPAKFNSLYEGSGGLPEEFKDIWTEPQDRPIVLTRENAGVYVNLLWPIGLSNLMSTNTQSPVNSKSLFNFASTGGWILGKEDNGGAYFNKFQIVPLNGSQEALITKVAQNTYRPCCNNSTFFQDCNHGSALLGLFQLGAAQGLSEKELYREALAFNSFWFPQQYLETAVYFKKLKHTDWKNVEPAVVMSREFSSASGWMKNVHEELSKIPNLLPQVQGGSGCGV
ncbi:MAG: hypothetical protein HYW95_01825 [Candidatus Wildermuthbacteria bacterium]|nr:hypothetical protein [Candidatus Wildermuthbacteria bacterium]